MADRKPISSKNKPKVGVTPSHLGSGYAADAARKAKARRKKQKEQLDKI